MLFKPEHVEMILKGKKQQTRETGSEEWLKRRDLQS